jgi:hypothetical protein
MIFTRANAAAFKEALTSAIVSACVSYSQAGIGGTVTEGSRLFSILSLMPEDDSWQWIPSMTVDCEAVPVGEEGIDITIERL